MDLNRISDTVEIDGGTAEVRGGRVGHEKSFTCLPHVTFFFCSFPQAHIAKKRRGCHTNIGAQP